MSHKQFLEAQRSSLYDDYDDFSNEGKELLDEYKLKIRQTKLAAELSSSLFSLYKGQALDLKVKLQDHNDRFTALLKKDTLLTLQIAKADSIKTVGYQAVCFYQMRRKDQSVKKDTTFVPLNADKNIVERQDF